MLWLILLFLIIIMCVIIIRFKNREFVKLYEQLPCSIKPVPIFGHILHIMGSAKDRMSTLQRLGRDSFNFDGIESIWALHRLFVVVSNAEAVELVTKKCLNKDEVVNIARLLIGDGSVHAPVPIWRPRRKALVPIFSQKTLNSFVKIFSKRTSIMAEQLKQFAGKGNTSIFRYVTTYAMDAVCETTLGFEVNAQSNPNHPFLIAFKDVCGVFAYRLMRPWFYSDFLFKFTPMFSSYVKQVQLLKSFVDEIIKSKRKNMELREKNNHNEEKTDDEEYSTAKSIIEQLMESSDTVCTDLELQEETLVMVLAGTDTSAVGISFVALSLAKYPEIQERVYEEINGIFGDSDRPVEANDLPNFKYLDVVIKETLRMYPPVPIISREVEKPVKLPNGVTMIPGVGVIVHIWATHRNPKYWGDDADVFRPERFLDSPPKHPAAFIPFGCGPRTCIGYQYATMSMKVAVATLVRNYRLLPPCNPDGSIKDCFKNKEEPFPVMYEIMMKDVDNFAIRLESRN